MIRYTKQYDRFSCGPVAIINAMKWAGVKFSWRKYRDRMRKICQTDRGEKGGPVAGTTVSDFESVLETMSENLIDIRRIECPSELDLRSHLKSGGAVIIDLSWWDEQTQDITGHLGFLAGLTSGEKYYQTVNIYDNNKAIRRRSIQKLDEDINWYDSVDGWQKHYQIDANYWLNRTKAWLLTKIENNNPPTAEELVQKAEKYSTSTFLSRIFWC